MTKTCLDILDGYRPWKKADKQRANSVEVDYGYFWTRFGSEREFPRWRVSWIKNTGELVAVQPAKDKYILLGMIVERAQVDAVTEGWANSGSEIYHCLAALAKRVNLSTSQKHALTTREMAKDERNDYDR